MGAVIAIKKPRRKSPEMFEKIEKLEKQFLEMNELVFMWFQLADKLPGIITNLKNTALKLQNDENDKEALLKLEAYGLPEPRGEISIDSVKNQKLYNEDL